VFSTGTGIEYEYRHCFAWRYHAAIEVRGDAACVVSCSVRSARTHTPARSSAISCAKPSRSDARTASHCAGFVEERLAFCDTLPASMTSSMSHDLSRGGRLELPWLSGGIVELGERVGVAAPLNRAVRDILMLCAEGRIQG
jgi:ketopantoate reductase